MASLFAAAGVTLESDNAKLRLNEVLRDCRTCAKCAHPRFDRALLWEGNPWQPDVAFLVSQPYEYGHAREELLTGESSRTFDKMLAKSGLARNCILLASTMACRVDNGAPPDEEELRNCAPHWKAVVKAAAPHVVVVMGEDAAAAMFGFLPVRDRFSATKRLEGEWLEWAGYPVRYMPSPANMVSYPETRKRAWAAMQAVLERLRAIKEGFK